MSAHSDTLSWFRANQSLLFLLDAVCLAEKQQIPILLSLVWPNQGSNPRPTALGKHANHYTTDGRDLFAFDKLCEVLILFNQFFFKKR
jgi:hypothetical protein